MRWKKAALAVVALSALLGACAAPPEPVATVSGDRAELSMPHSAWLPLTLSWRMSSPLAGLAGEPRVLLHLIDGAGELVRTFDHSFPGGWRVGEESSYPVPLFQSILASPLDEGVYRLRIGLYDADGHRWPVRVQGEDGLGEPVIATVRVAEPEVPLPEFSFSAEWLPLEPGEDLQILARRWLAGDGAVRIRGLEGAGSLWMRLGIPSASELQEVVLEPGADQPRVRVTADCSAYEAEIAGVGGHTLEVPVAPSDTAAGECRIRFSANFALTSKVNSEKKSIALENLAWRAL